MTAATPSATRDDLLSALRKLGGKATVGDVVAATGRPSDAARAELDALLGERRGHLAVTDSGEILYDFHPALLERGREPLLSRMKRTAWSLFRKGFKAWIVVTLVVYFVVFVALVIAAIFAQRQGGDRRSGGWGGGRHRHGHFGFGDFWLWYWLMGRGWPRGRPYYGRRWERTLGRDQRAPFYKKVFAFVFGPDRPEPDQAQRDRSVLQLARARKGVLTTADLVQHTALPVPDAEDEMGRLVGAYGGEPLVSPEGELAFAFPGLMASAAGLVAEREPRPAWQRLEPPREVTGNELKDNLLVGAINGFNLVAAATAPFFIFPRLGLGGPLAWIGLVVVPVIYSLVFFAVPGLRTLAVRRENRRRERRNVRRVLLGLVYEMTLEKGAGVMVGPATAYVARRLDGRTVTRGEVEAALQELAAEFEAEVEPDPVGELIYRFPRLRRQFVAAEAARRMMGLDRKELGPVVWHTGDTAAEADRRDGDAFDRALAESRSADLGRYVPSTARVSFEDEWEVLSP